MTIKVYKVFSNIKRKPEILDINFSSFEGAEAYVDTNIVSTFIDKKYIIFKKKNIAEIKQYKEYMLLDENNFQIYSYVITES